MNILFIFIGCIFLCLGFIGIYLPILPHTPFLILAAVCFGKGSERFNNWFISSKIYKSNVEPIVNKEGISLSRKYKIMGIISIFFALSFYFMTRTGARALLIAIWLFHVYFFFKKIKTLEEKENA